MKEYPSAVSVIRMGSVVTHSGVKNTTGNSSVRC